MAQFSGNTYGNIRLLVFGSTGGTNANLVGTIADSGTTTQYLNAGGSNFATGASLTQFLSNLSYLNYSRKEQEVKTQLLADGGITFSTSDVTPDPRIVFGVLAHEQGLTGHHMDEIHYTNAGGITYQAFLGRLTYSAGHTDGGSTLVPDGQVLVDLVSPGISGSNVSDDDLYQITAGATIVNKTNGMADTGCTLAGGVIVRRIDTNLHREYTISHALQTSITDRLDSDGLTGATIGDTQHLRHVRYNPYSNQLLDFIQTSSHLTTNASAITGDADRPFTVFTLHGISASGLTGGTYGISLNAITGGTVTNTSLLSEFSGKVVGTKTAIDNVITTTTITLNEKESVRSIDEVSY